MLGLGLLLRGSLACQSAAPAAAGPALPDSAPAPELIRYERTACFGPCPVDVLRVFADGRLRYEGGAHAPRTGPYTGQLSAAERTALVQQFEAAQFFNLAPAYVSRATDLPTYYLTYSAGGRSRRVKDYGAAPVRLKNLEAQLEKLIDADRWRPDLGGKH